jgi:hypothetical protein
VGILEELIKRAKKKKFKGRCDELYRSALICINYANRYYCSDGVTEREQHRHQMFWEIVNELKDIGAWWNYRAVMNIFNANEKIIELGLHPDRRKKIITDHREEMHKHRKGSPMKTAAEKERENIIDFCRPLTPQEKKRLLGSVDRHGHTAQTP